ncbi:MAG: tetratricopeptide repeat protein [Planctomycetota bacterium]|nr:tetratricopeptide repeat protein [Planctomycetota bacterium]
MIALRATAVLLVLVSAACSRDPRTLLPRETPTPAEERFGEASRVAAAGNVESALATYREAVALDRAAVRPHLRYVRQMLRLGRRAELRRDYDARAAAPGATDAERTIAERLRTNGASSALRRVYTAAAERNPRSPWWRLALAEVEIAEADAWNERRVSAIERADRKEELTAFQQSASAVKRAQRALAAAAEIDPQLAEVHLFRGFLRGVEGDLQPSAPAREAAYRAAEAAFSSASSRSPDMVEAWGALGDIRFRLGDARGSLIAFLEAVRLAPADATLRISLGVALHEADRLAEAAVQYRQAAALSTWDPDPLLRLGDALADDERWDPALAAYREALQRDPNAVEAHRKTGMILEYLERPGQARAAYERYVTAGGERSSSVKRRIERLLRAEER